MRCTTSAITTTILGAILTAPVVWTQELTPVDRDPGDKSTHPDGVAAESAPLYGMTTSRGARYLLRNGLDYLDYQQYERSLKFLREVETRKKELNDAEKLELKLGIERAQRGLREAADAHPPYALSERSQHRNGFSVANPETWSTARTNQVTLPTRKTKTNQIGQSNLMGSELEHQGEPVRLAGGEAPADCVSQYTTNFGSPQNTRPVLDQSRFIPKIPKLLAASQLAKVTESGLSLKQHLATDLPSTAVTEPEMAENDLPEIIPPLVPVAEPVRPADGTVAHLSNRGTAPERSEVQQPLPEEITGTKLKADWRAKSISAAQRHANGGTGLDYSTTQVPVKGMAVSPVPIAGARRANIGSSPYSVPQITPALTSNRILQPPSASPQFRRAPILPQ